MALLSETGLELIKGRKFVCVCVCVCKWKMSKKKKHKEMIATKSYADTIKTLTEDWLSM